MVYIDECPELFRKLQERVARRAAADALQEELEAAERRRQEEAAHAALHPVPEVIEQPRRRKRWRHRERQRFLRSVEWLEVRKVIFARDGEVCAYCGSVEKLQIDHIKPRSKFPELALEQTNLQVLCWPCNKKKAAKY